MGAQRRTPSASCSPIPSSTRPLVVATAAPAPTVFRKLRRRGFQNVQPITFRIHDLFSVLWLDACRQGKAGFARWDDLSPSREPRGTYLPRNGADKDSLRDTRHALHGSHGADIRIFLTSLFNGLRLEIRNLMPIGADRCMAGKTESRSISLYSPAMGWANPLAVRSS